MIICETPKQGQNHPPNHDRTIPSASSVWQDCCDSRRKIAAAEKHKKKRHDCNGSQRRLLCYPLVYHRILWNGDMFLRVRAPLTHPLPLPTNTPLHIEAPRYTGTHITIHRPTFSYPKSNNLGQLHVGFTQIHRRIIAVETPDAGVILHKKALPFLGETVAD